MESNIAVFKDSENINVNGGVFIMGADKYDKVDVYLRTASTHAILNAGGRPDEVRCYPGTREEVISKIERWRDGQSKPDRRMLWLSGHGGAGKSAIAQTVAECGAESKIHSANFFFFRTDNTRNHAGPLVATLVYQLVKLYPALRQHLTDIMTAQPLASTAPVKEQFAELLTSSIELLASHTGDGQRSSVVVHKIFLIIDGLEECDNEAEQLQILGALHHLVRTPGSPFRVMIASRREPQILRFFNLIADSVQSLFLSDEYQPDADIRKFVITKFDEIKRSHHLAHTLGEHWPTQTDIDKIVSKSSGQFIYAATVMRFIDHSKDSPELSLLTVHEMRRPTTQSPFAQPDALYSHVFSKARDIRPIKWAIGAVFGEDNLIWTSCVVQILDIGGYGPIELQGLFADISAIARVSISDRKLVEVEFYHASLPDYLRNKSRSGDYHVDLQEILADACAIGLSKFHDKESLDVVSMVFSCMEQPTSKLTTSLLGASKRRFGHDFANSSHFRVLPTHIIELYFTTDKAMCGRILHGWIHFAYIHNLDVEVDKNVMGLTAYRYFRKIRLIEKAKFIIGLVFTRDGR